MVEHQGSQGPRASRAAPKLEGEGADGVDAAVARWQSHLLQLNRSNNLLYFKGNTAPKDPTSSRRATIRCVPINRFNPDGIDDYLQRARRGRTFDFARRRRRRRRTDLEPASADQVEADAEIEFVPGDLPTDVEPLALQRVLLRFLRKEREWMEEQGINVLFLAAGFLEWIDEDRERAKAPLLLLPCDLQRSSPGEPFVLRREDDDATANATLRHKLREFEITLPEFDHETYGDYLREVSELTAGRDGWRVTEEVVLSTFQYTKLAMWEDLDQMQSVGVTHPLVRRLAGEPMVLDSDGSVVRDAFPTDSELAGGRLDDILNVRQEVVVLPADHSQLRAVAAARDGANLVIHGPPGTGKSQTIVNIISNLLAEGKRVLFVSEKSVALDVVKDRLDQEDLGVFCLDMHSDRASKTSVYEQLRSSIDDNGQVNSLGYDFAELEANRTTLNEVVRALHEPRQPLGRSVYEIHGEYAQLRDLPDVEFRVPGVAAIDEPHLRATGSVVDRIARRPDEFRELRSSKWSFLKLRTGSVGLADRIKRDANTVRGALGRTEASLKEQAALLGTRTPANLDEASDLHAIASHLAQKPPVLRHWLCKDTLTKLRRVASEQREQQRQALMLAERTGKPFRGRAPAIDYQQLSRSIRPIDGETRALRQAFGAGWSARIMPDPRLFLDSTERVRVNAAGFVALLSELASKIGATSTTGSWLESSHALDLAREVVATGTVPETWLDLDHIASFKYRVRVARLADKNLAEAESELAVSFDLELADEVDSDALIRFHRDYRSDLRRLIGNASLEVSEPLHAAAVALLDTLAQLSSLLGSDLSASSWRWTVRALQSARDLDLCLRDMGLVPEVWLEGDRLDETKRLVHAAASAHEALHNAESGLFEEFDPEFVEAVDDDLLHRLRVDHQSRVRRLLGGAWRRDQRLLRGHAKVPRSFSVTEALNAVQRALEAQELRGNWDSAYAAVEPLLGPYASGRETDWRLLQQLIDQTAHQLIEWPWEHTALRTLLTDFKARQTLRQTVVRAESENRAMQSALHSVHEHRLDEESVGPVGVVAITKMANTALALLGNHSKTATPVTVNSGLEATQRAVAIRELRERWSEAYSDIELHIGRYARSRQTDWAELETSLRRVEGLLISWPWQQDRLRMLLTNSTALRALDGTQLATRERLKSLKDSLEVLDSERLDLRELGPSGVTTAVEEAVRPLERLEKATRSVVEKIKIAPTDWQSLCDLTDDLARLQSIEQDERESRSALRHDFGEWFSDRSTDWDGVLEAIHWCHFLFDKAGQRLSERLSELVCADAMPIDPVGIAEAIESLQSAYSSDIRVLHQRFEVTDAPWRSWEAAPFSELSDWIDTIQQDADSAANWIEFKLAADELDRTFGPDAVQRIREATDNAALVPGIVNRRLFATWLDAVTQQDSRLRDFTGRDHEALRCDFRSLDRQLPRVLRERARTELFEKYPKSRTGVTRSGQLGVLRGELTKRRRQLSVRHLLAAAPQLIQALKPCFLMSPLAVSQYLERTGATSANLHFDTVVFDEASQVLPEDAVPAISRANQTIVVGDRRQLPPTTLFQHRYEHEDDDDDGDEETDWFEGRESILDVMVGMVGSGVAEHYLGVHYRSRHDSLIRYSNHYFYDDRLLTFPSPRKPAAHGVRAVYLPDGRYDSGGSRTNRVEAEKVVELVFELLATRPKSESIGVVTLSRAQADLIETLVDEAREFHPEYEGRFARDRQERFFVKNLENVQGDERDHILLSVCYGPTESGRIYNRFGPINNEGGERRLNVAVSRARRSMTILHSLKPEDITSESRGARLLRRYLEFARSPDTALGEALAVNGSAKPESPFEESVRRALVESGHRVDTQVGVAGYRIDLAIQAEDGEGYALGIECDGATYHSAPAARDRDWLRQSVLEGLGWKIHRVWSRAWIQNPERELDSIEHALNAAEAQGPDSEDAQNGTDIEVDLDITNEGRLAEVADDEWAEDEQESSLQDHAEPKQSGEGNALFNVYREVDLSTFRVGRELRLESISRLSELITEVVRIEGPVHRDIVLERVRRRFRASRMRGVTRQRFLSAIRKAARDNRLWLGEENSGAAAQHQFLMDPADAEFIAPRAPASDDSRRRIEHISLAELKAGILVCVEMLFGAGRDDLIAETARQFGYRRTGRDIARRIGKAVDQLVHAGKLTGDDQMLTVADSA